MSRLDEMMVVAQQHKGMLDATQADAIRLHNELKDKEKTLDELNVHHADLEFCYKYLDLLIKNESNRFIAELQKVLDSGVHTIFDDRDYAIDIVVEDNKRASIHLKYIDDEGNEISPDIRDCGGGIRTVVGLLMQIFFLFHYQVEKLLVVDEGLSMVSSEYLPNLFGLLDNLARNNHLKILLITHDERMKEYATKQYVVENNKAKLIG